MKKIIFILLILLLAACNLPWSDRPSAPTIYSPTNTAVQLSPTITNPPPSTEEVPKATPTLASSPTSADAPLPPVNVPRPASLFHAAPVAGWEPATFQGQDIPLPVDPSEAANPSILGGLTDEQSAMLEENGFVVIQSQEAQFGDIRQVGKYFGQPYFLTTDAAFHAVHLTFDELLKAIEKQDLRPRMVAMVKALLDEILAYLDETQGTPLESDAELAAAYLSVALRLFDPSAQVEDRLAQAVEQQLAQIDAGGGQDRSTLIPGFTDDYAAYKPVGHYAGDPALESYFRGMTWFGRVHFRLQNPEDPNILPSRAPLILTLALRRAEIGTGLPAIEEWSGIHTLLTFLVGPSDDAGPAEYSVLMDQVFGDRATLETLADEALWQAFQERSAELPTPQINSTFADSSEQMDQERGWRFLGQRFTLDSYILQNLVYDHVGTRDDPRKLPSGLDVMAAFGSQPALQALDEAGETTYANYPQQMEKLRGLVEAQQVDQWLDTVFGSWLYAFLPQIADKDAAYPSYMRTAAWGYKDLNSALGSWTELKHDTVLYSKMPEGYGGGGPPRSGPAPGYVEPNPPVFYRMAYLARSLSEGLQPYVGMIMLEPPSPSDFTYSMNGLAGYLENIYAFSGDLQALGDIAAKELAGVPLTADDYTLIQDCLGPVECQVEYMETMNKLSGGEAAMMEMPAVPVVAAIAGAENQILEAGVGGVDRIYVIVPLEDRLEIAQGGVFSYFEFPQPRAERLTDEEWRSRLLSEPPQRPAWATSYSLPGGNPTDVTFFRVGDVYIITEAGNRLNLRQSADTSAPILRSLAEGDYITLIDGPVLADGYTWWKLRLENYTDNPPEGWAVENQTWYERAWGQ